MCVCPLLISLSTVPFVAGGYKRNNFCWLAQKKLKINFLYSVWGSLLWTALFYEFSQYSLSMICSSSTIPEPSRPWPKTPPLPFSSIMTDCKEVCVPICCAWPDFFWPWPLTLQHVVFQSVSCSIGRCLILCSSSVSTFVSLLHFADLCLLYMQLVPRRGRVL